MNNYIALVFIALMYLLNGCSSGTSTNESEDVSIDGVWRSGPQVRSGYVLEFVWSFENGKFTKTLENRNGAEPSSELGIYSVGSSITMPSGVTANILDVTYIYDDSTLKKLDVVYVDNQILYFGSENINEACEGEYYQEDRFNLEVVNGTVRNVEEVTICLSRPTSLDFDTPYQLNNL
jgi:hypothetical protein